MRIHILGALFAITAVSNASSETGLQPLATSKEGNYAISKKFARCSGHFGFMATIAKSEGRDNSVRAFEGFARGWKITGMIFLQNSMSSDRATETEKTFDNMVDHEVTLMRARYEADPLQSVQAMLGDYKKICGPLVPTQEKLIELLDRGVN